MSLGTSYGDLSVLIVEDDSLTAFDMMSFLSDFCCAGARVAASVADAEAALSGCVDFVFLDVNVIGGDTFQFARRLTRDGVPFAFVSASDPANVPQDLRWAPFLAKPYSPLSIFAALNNIFHRILHPCAVRLGQEGHCVFLGVEDNG